MAPVTGVASSERCYITLVMQHSHIPASRSSINMQTLGVIFCGLLALGVVTGQEGCCGGASLREAGGGELTLFDKWDTEQTGIMIDVNPIEMGGEINKISFVAGGTPGSARAWQADTRLYFGVFRPVEGEDYCTFTVIKKKLVGTNFTNGQTYEVDLDTCIPVQAGDSIGFYWNRYGVVSYKDSFESDEGSDVLDMSPPRYCTGNGRGDSKPVVGENVKLRVSEASQRVYAFQATYCNGR